MNRYGEDITQIKNEICHGVKAVGHADDSGYVFKYVLSSYKSGAKVDVVLLEVSKMQRYLQLSTMQKTERT